MSGAVIRTERLIISPLTDADAIPLASVCNQEHIVRNMPDWRMTVNGAKRVVNAFAMGNELNDPQNQSVALAIRLRSESGAGELVGFLGAGPRYELGYDVEIGYFVAKKYLRRGIAAEAVAGTVGYARDAWRMKSLRAVIAPDNLPSAGVVKKCGFSLEKTVSFRYAGSIEKLPYDVYLLTL